MKIVFYYSSIYNGGAERVITALANDFSERGDEVFIIVYDDGRSGYQLSVKVTVIPLDVMGDSHSLVAAANRAQKEARILRRRVLEIQPDIIFAFSNRMAVTAKWATLGLNIKVVGSERSNPYVARNGWKEQLFVKQAGILDGFVFQTEGAKGFYPKRIQKKSVVIPNAVFSPPEQKLNDFSERSPFSLIATGRIVPSKRYDLIIDAMAEVIKSFPEAKLDIYGTGDRDDEIKKYIQKQGMQNYVIMRGRVMNVQEQLASHQIFVMASEDEGMPNGLIEAMAAGCVCISSDCDFGPSELITDGVDGFLFPVGDVKQLTEYIIEAFSNTERSTEIAEAATRINQRLAFSVIADKFHDYLTTR